MAVLEMPKARRKKCYSPDEFVMVKDIFFPNVCGEAELFGFNSNDHYCDALCGREKTPTCLLL